MKPIRFDDGIPPGFTWSTEPRHATGAEGLTIITSPHTDFWQRTHYGFRRDNGHCLLTNLKSDFSISVKTNFEYRGQYDQCGLLVRVDPDNWIKVSMEYEDPSLSRLGSVVTNFGYSDWATQDIMKPVHGMRYRIQRTRNDYLIEAAFAEGTGQPNDPSWFQLRLAHLHSSAVSAAAGIYACSPSESSFEARFTELVIG